MVSAGNAKWKLLVASGPVEGVVSTAPFDGEGAGHVTIVLFAGAPVGGPFRALEVQEAGGTDRYGRLVGPADVPGCVAGSSTPHSGSAALPGPADANKVWAFELDCCPPRKRYLGPSIITGGPTALTAFACLSRDGRPAAARVADAASRGLAAVYRA